MRSYEPRATQEHMPFAGHRTQGTIRRQREATEARVGRMKLRVMEEYGFNAEILHRD